MYFTFKGILKFIFVIYISFGNATFISRYYRGCDRMVVGLTL